MTTDVVAGIETPRHVVIDGVCGNEADRDNTRQRHGGHQVEHRNRSEEVGEAASQQGCAGITGVVERFVAPGTAGKRFGPGDAQGNGRDGRCKYRGRNAAQRLGQGDNGKRRGEGQNQATQRHQQGRHTDHGALVGRAVDQRPCRCLGQQPGNAGNGHHHADAGRVPFVHRQQIDRQIRAQAIADIGKEEIQAIQ